ncbi:amidohydrolase family protein [Novosphingobium sp.]|uniref:amidohydrolase family protein n=1 Tax=Novosphingobium sp. TaxID=1874826 RepID=UPI0038B74907
MSRHTAVALAVAVLLLSPSSWARPAILDMHLHALAADEQGPPPLSLCSPIAMPTWDPAHPAVENFAALFAGKECRDPIVSPKTDDEVMTRSIAQMEKYNVIGLVSGPKRLVDHWRATAPARMMPSLIPDMPVKDGMEQEFAALHASRDVVAIGELGLQYDGIGPDDPRVERIWAMAEKEDLPVSIHMGPGPPGVGYLPGSGYRARLSSPLLLEEVLLRHPRLRINVMHAGFPMRDDTLALLYSHPQVYVDLGVIDWTQPRAAFHAYLKALIDAGFAKRVMFGSDQMVWPEAIGKAIEAIDSADFLTAEQKRDIFYNNAARFLRLDAATIARHTAM